MMTLYGYWRSSASYRVRIALNMKGLTARHVSINLKDGEQRSAEYRARNPQGFVPMLELGDGTRLTQSLAILDYLDAAYPEPQLYPLDPALRAQVLSAALVIASDIHPIQNSSVLGHIKSKYAQDQEAANLWARTWITRGFTALEAIASKSQTKFLYTQTPSLFEVCLIPQVYNAKRYGVDMSAFARLSALDAACLALPEFSKASPQHQADSPQA